MLTMVRFNALHDLQRARRGRRGYQRILWKLQSTIVPLARSVLTRTMSPYGSPGALRLTVYPAMAEEFEKRKAWLEREALRSSQILYIRREEVDLLRESVEKIPESSG